MRKYKEGHVKKVIAYIAIACVVLHASAWSSGALETTLLDMRKRIVDQSNEIRLLLTKTNNVVFVNNMWNTGLLTMTQLEAYFFMLGIFNTLRSEDLSEESVGYLSLWLNEIKRTNMAAIKALTTVSMPLEPDTQAQVQKLKSFYVDLTAMIDTELTKLSALKKTAPKKKK